MSITTSNATYKLRKLSRPNTSSTLLSLAVDAAGLAKGTSLAQLDAGQWARWSRYLARRKHPIQSARHAPTQRLAPLLWGIEAGENVSDASELIAQLQRRLLTKRQHESGLSEVALAWLKEARSRLATAELGIESLAWCHALPALAGEFPAPLWRQLLEQLLAISHDAAAIDGQPSPLAQQVLAGELPLTLAGILPEIAACARLAKTGRDVVSDGVIELLDEGLPRGEHLAIARPLLACWTRAMLVGESLRKGSFRSGAQDHYRNFVRHMVCLSRPDGSQVLAPTTAAPGELLDAALAVAGDERATASADALCRGESPPQNGKRRLLLPTAVHSEWSELAVLRANWSKNSPALAIIYTRGQFECELVSQQRVLWSGRCEPEICVDGQPLDRPQRWEEVCWFSDDDVHYIELEGEMSGGWKTQRQFLLARTDAILFIADAIFGPVNAQLDYRCIWPTPASMSFTPATETCEGTLHTGGRRWANVVPLALPEWRSDGRRRGSLQGGEGGLAYQLSSQAQRLYVPLVVDLEPWRIKRELTWRQLAVGHNLTPQSPEVAIGYRVQLYKQQWLIYRSLAERASRTVLGQNIYNEFCFARFNRGGDADSLIEIE